MTPTDNRWLVKSHIRDRSHQSVNQKELFRKYIFYGEICDFL